MKFEDDSPVRKKKPYPSSGLDLAARVLLGGVFLYASLDKILHPADFARAIYNYQILPNELINLAAIVLPWLELLLGLCLLSGIWLPGAVLLSNGLLWAFFLALLFNYFRGLDVHCGCFFTKQDLSNAPMTWYLVRDPIFLLVGGYLMVRQFMKKEVPAAPSPGSP